MTENKAVYLVLFTFEWINKSLGCLNVYYGSLRQNLHLLPVYFGVPSVNRGKTGKMLVDTPKSVSYFW